MQGGHTYLDAALNEAIKIFDSVTASQEEIQNILITISDGWVLYSSCSRNVQLNSRVKVICDIGSSPDSRYFFKSIGLELFLVYMPLEI